MRDDGFISAISTFLSSSNQATPEEVLPKSTKSGQEFVETKNTINPRLVTEMFRELLSGLGRPSRACRFYKHTRDEVCWQATRIPWRRSPSWLFLRIALQIGITASAPDEQGEAWYKKILLHALCRFAKLALTAKFDSESLFTMTAKLTRRALKLDPLRVDPWLRVVNETIKDIQCELSRRWNLLEMPAPYHTAPAKPPTPSTRTADTAFEVKGLRAYLEQGRSDFEVETGVEGDANYRRFELSTRHLPDIHLSSTHATRDTLFDFECWVSQCLDGWLEDHLDHPEVHSNLAGAIAGYTQTALRIYADSPEDFSILVLTAVELWVALDTAAIRHFPLLCDFPPELSGGLFDPLLLKNKAEMKRLLRTEQYLKTRLSNAKSNSPSVLRSFAESQSIAVRHFNKSAEHQSLLAQVNKSNKEQQASKLQEYRSKRTQHNQLKRRIESLSCKYETKIDEEGFESTDHVWPCEKCQLLQEAGAIKIEYYERSLPARQHEQQAVAFELAPPSTIKLWRDTTFYLLTEVFASPATRSWGDEMRPLDGYKALSGFISNPLGRLTLASSVKPFAVTHYCEQQHIASVAEGNLIVPNAMRYSMHDSRRDVWVESAFKDPILETKCAFRLPPGPWGGLQYAVTGTAHTTNAVMAEQDCAPSQVSPLEYYSFASLRSGNRLQWRNLLRELVNGNLELNRFEVNMIVCQVVWQAGTAASTTHYLRDAQLDFYESGFSIKVLRAVKAQVLRIQGNWQNTSALLLLITITTKVLSLLHPHGEYVQSLLLLDEIRQVALEWLGQITRVYESEADDLTRKSLRIRAFEVALISHLTYAIDKELLEEVLSSADQVAVLSKCLLNIDEYRDAKDGDSLLVPLLLHRSMRLSHTFEFTLRLKILQCPKSLDKTIQTVWPDFERGPSVWKADEGVRRQYLTVVTRDSTVFQFDLLLGRLLMNKRRFSRLPDAYERHPTFKRILQGMKIDVIPSMVPGMTYTSRHSCFGSKLHFGMTRTHQLIIRADCQSKTFELIPHTVFQQSLPNAFTRDYVHWLDVERNSIQCRLLNDAFNPSQTVWELEINQFRDANFVKGPMALIGPHTKTAEFVYRHLDVIERKEHIHIFLDKSSNTLAISLPRLALDFDVKDHSSQISSRQFRGMHIENGFRLKTLTGLKSRIILRRNDSHSRTLIIPRGSVKRCSTDSHVKVEIDTGSDLAIRYHAYEIDDVLQRLVDDDSLTSKLYRCYLHAITSHCLPDSFSGKTGTEQAIDILTSSPMMSPEDLGAEDLALLSKLEACSPRRCYYPSHLRVSQTVNWSELPTLSQNPSIAKHVLAIIEHAKSQDMFREQRAIFPEFGACAPEGLFTRAVIRDSHLRSLDYGAKNHTQESDAGYKGREPGKEQPSAVFHMAQLVDAWSARLDVSRNLMARMERLNIIHPAQSATIASLGYSKELLAFSDDFLRREWCRLTQLFSSANAVRDKYQVLLAISTMAYSQKADLELIRTLLAFATVENLRCNPMDCPSSLNLSEKYETSRGTIKTLVGGDLVPFQNAPESRLSRNHGETKQAWSSRSRALFQVNQDKHIVEVVEWMIQQWTLYRRLGRASGEHRAYINLDSAISRCRSQFLLWDNNREFQSRVSVLQSHLDMVRIEPEEQRLRDYTLEHMRLPPYTRPDRTRHLSWDQALRATVPATLSSNNTQEIKSLIVKDESTSFSNTEHTRLDALLDVLELEDARLPYEHSYVDSLSASRHQVRAQSRGDSIIHPRMSQHQAMTLLSARTVRASRYYRHLRGQLMTGFPGAQVLPHVADFFLRLPSSSLLKLVASNSQIQVPSNWRECLVKYGVLLTEMQHARRIMKALQDDSDILPELQDFDHQHWDPVQRPDWLLFELEGNLLIRKTQIDVAEAMISPSSGANSLMQLNMGEGKSSVIVPIAVAALGDGTKLTRIVILKPLAKQMLILLTRKLGGLLGRRIFSMPVSRSVRFTEGDVRTLRTSLEACRQLGGVLLVQPEHLLSFHLMSIEQSLEQSNIAAAIHGLNRWLTTQSRDILDESDELLDPRDELIYAMGSQQSCDLGPERWTLIQQILGLMQRHVISIQNEYDGIQVEAKSDGSVPYIRVLDDSDAKSWIGIVVDQVLGEGLQGLQSWFLASLPPEDWSTFFQDPLASEMLQERVRCSCRGDEVTWRRLLFLRGLFAKGVIQYAFQKKRWRVEFGKDLSRTKLAVPYRAKDTPSTQSEFSHPDVAIVLTCLSYYYEQLTDEELHLAFETVFQLDDAYDEYLKWTKSLPAIPKQYRTLGGINMQDPLLSKTVFPALRCGKGVIDFYLSHHVFPREMKEFPHKLSSSGWDLVKAKTHAVTGFSGTNDSRALLPSSIEQHDLPHLQGTNAEMLAKLLRQENEFLPTCDGASSQPLSVAELLKAVTSHAGSGKMRVVLDVGAQILELSNRAFCTAWLESAPDPTIKAVVFFDEDNNLCVIDRLGAVERLVTSPFARRMGECMVYLDESHTRGTDLKLPQDYRAAVTLGPGLTKDKLAQACMRMRKLGRGQSVTLIASAEITKQILGCCGKEVASDIDVADVLRWTIQNTWTRMKRCAPLWNTQRKRHMMHQSILQSVSDSELPLSTAEQLLEPEAQSIEQRYGPYTAKEEDETLDDDVRSKLESFGISETETAAFDEEQERELAPEIEQQTQKERPLRKCPATHSIHDDLRLLIRTGRFKKSSKAFMRAFQLFRSTNASSKYPAEIDMEELWITKDFSTTVILTRTSPKADDYIRPVNWVLRSRNTTAGWDGCLVISPFEANELLPCIRESRFVDLALFSSRKSELARPLERLDYCNAGGEETPIARRLSLFLGLFSGQVYFETYEDYICLSRALGLPNPTALGCKEVHIDGFIGPLARKAFDSSWGKECAFTSSPVEFLKAIGLFMRKGSTKDRSHLGRMLAGELLSKDDFEDFTAA